MCYSHIPANFPWMVSPLRYLVLRSKRGQAFETLESTAAELVRLRRAAKESSKVGFLLGQEAT